jgi:TonB family protein
MSHTPLTSPIRLATLLVLLFVALAAAGAQESVQIAPEEAATHLVKKVDPVYPAFAKAAGIDGLVSIQVGIYPDGRIHSVSVESGPRALVDAAVSAVTQYVYTPFTESGHTVNAQTTVEIPFILPADASRQPIPTPPVLILQGLRVVAERELIRQSVQSFPQLACTRNRPTDRQSRLR